MKRGSFFHTSRGIYELRKELRYENRFFLSDKCSKFVDDLINYAKESKIHKVESNIKLFRARIHDPYMKPKHYSLKDMGALPAHKVTQGRINPTGIQYLYLSNDIKTAVAEVRPWAGCKITVAKFTLNQDISLINFSNKVSVTNRDSEKINKAEHVWRELIADMFSMPLDPRDDTAYVPIQYISEKVKKEGFDGILWDSALNLSGCNICVFNVKAAEARKLFKVSVQSMAYQYEVDEVTTN